MNYTGERKTVRALQAARELVREEPCYARPARIWRTSLGQSEVVTGETAAVVLPPGGRRQAIKNERKTILAAMQKTPESEASEISGGEYHGRISSN